ncbi:MULTISPECIES: ketopantoate reductase family protein [Shewanella]|uniref:ketopantoate reductase family protein n=1 Tax=Shewanella TaxID=22 RepID=UPI0021DB00C7|nr:MULTISPECIES: 2-dehydropantoate 2-reductase [unclassified Shewanella]MCU8021856.1 2-dehydropantoate 2-reductase [Shewanella sp. SM78]MCU8043255.1 2-dehydropantoate 2-reductase [Shewanella sp. SM68]MCU8047629.1 2-dehydropantoate 2-reductase [Shewanella sp. SM65]MCU8079044.1 2-dehydropantoate 2-reductase [Shewanella sp. SM103]MCU8082876.1 2-dehydropantoate 2-reductase [Shewanella sp. SM23]
MTHAVNINRVVDIAILGAGAVGQLICHQLTTAGMSVGLIGRDSIASIQQTLSVTPLAPANDNQQKTQALQYSVPILAANALDNIRLVIVCVKAYQVLDALLPLLNQLPRQCHILLLHNGMGPHLALAPLIDAQADGRGLSLGTTSQGVLRQASWQIRQTGQGLTQFGHFTGTELTEHYRNALLTAIPNSEWVDAIVPCLWQKLAVNAAINPLTALYQCPNGTLAEPDFSDMIKGILDELVTVATLEGVPLDKQLLHDRVYQVIRLTARNFSSMHQDIAHQRRTEIDQINGYICERAQAHGLSAPVNADLWARVKQLEA